MNYFFKSLWFGALISPRCWLLALKNKELMPLAIAFVFSLALSLMFIPIVSKFAAILGGIWPLLMMLEMIAPNKQTILRYDGKLQTFCLYSADWTKAEENQKCFLRIFIQDGKKWKKTGETLYLKGFDSSLLGYGFFLIKRPYAEWWVFGNGNGSGSVLGQKVADYAFISSAKRKAITFLHNGTLVHKRFEKYEKCDKVLLNYEQTKFVSIADAQVSFLPLHRDFQDKGIFILLKNKGYYSLYKVISGLVYTVIADSFQIESESLYSRRRTFKKDGDFGYKLTGDISH